MMWVFKMSIRLATKLGKRSHRWNRRINIAGRRAMCQAHYALRKHPRYSLHNHDDIMDDDDDDTHMQDLESKHNMGTIV